MIEIPRVSRYDQMTQYFYEDERISIAIKRFDNSITNIVLRCSSGNFITHSLMTPKNFRFTASKDHVAFSLYNENKTPISITRNYTADFKEFSLDFGINLTKLERALL